MLNMSVNLFCLIQLFNSLGSTVHGSTQMLSVTQYHFGCIVTPTQFHMHPELTFNQISISSQF